MQICWREDDFLADLEKCCKMRIWTRKSALIQPRTGACVGADVGTGSGPGWGTSLFSLCLRCQDSNYSCPCEIETWLRNFANFKMNISNTSKVSTCHRQNIIVSKEFVCFPKSFNNWSENSVQSQKYYMY